MPDQINVNESTPTLREVTVAIYDTSSAPVTGISEANVTIKVSKAGTTAFSASTATLTEITSATSGGLYILRFPAGEVDTLGDLRFEIASGSTTIDAVLGSVEIVNPPATAVWDHLIEGVYSTGDFLRGIAAVSMGRATGFDTGARTYRDVSDTKERVIGSVTDEGRTSVTVDLT